MENTHTWGCLLFGLHPSVNCGFFDSLGECLQANKWASLCSSLAPPKPFAPHCRWRIGFMLCQKRKEPKDKRILSKHLDELWFTASRIKLNTFTRGQGASGFAKIWPCIYLKNRKHHPENVRDGNSVHHLSL